MAQCKCGEESYGRQSMLYNIDNWGHDELKIFLPRHGGENFVTPVTYQENNFPELFFLRNVSIQVSVDFRYSENEPAVIHRKGTKTGLDRAAEIESNVCGDKKALPICNSNLTPLNSTLSSTKLISDYWTGILSFLLTSVVMTSTTNCELRLLLQRNHSTRFDTTRRHKTTRKCPICTHFLENTINYYFLYSACRKEEACSTVAYWKSPAATWGALEKCTFTKKNYTNHY